MIAGIDRAELRHRLPPSLILLVARLRAGRLLRGQREQRRADVAPVGVAGLAREQAS